MNPTILNTLQRYYFYREAPASLQDEIERAAIRVRLDQGTFLYHRGCLCKSITLVEAGSIRVFVDAESRREVTLYRIGPGDTCPINLLCTLLGHKAQAHACVETELSGVALPAEMARRWVAQHAPMRQFAFESLSTRLVDVLLRIEEVTFQRIDRRLATYLLRQFKESAKQPPAIRITHERIAQELGSAREVITRVLKTFERAGAVTLARGHIVLRNHGPLQQFGSDAGLTDMGTA